MCARYAIPVSVLTILLASGGWGFSSGREKDPAKPALRWEESQPGCTFSRDDDGKYRYGFWTADYGIILAVDAQELEKARRRQQPILALFLSVHYRGTDSLEVAPSKMALEFVKHFHDEPSALDSEALANQQQRDIDALRKEIERESQKYPEKKQEKEAALAGRIKDASEMIEFLQTRSLRAITLSSAHNETSGWLLFSSKSKWIDSLRKQEEFVLRVPMGNQVVEFPFSLPPSEGDLILRSRPEQ